MRQPINHMNLGAEIVSAHIDYADKLFNVEGWGQVGLANLDAFVPFPGFKSHRDLEVNEVTEGKLQKPGSDHKPERITRIK